MRWLWIVVSALMLTGCAGRVGPANIPGDSMNYNQAVRKGIDSQLLLNIVRLRYRDNPTFLQVGVISSSYDFKRFASAEFKVEDLSGGGKTSFTPKFGAEFTEKPTTTYSPVRGHPFVKEVLTPVSLEVVTLLSASGWNMDRIMRCCVQRINHMRNAPSASGPTPEYTPAYRDFLAFTDLIHQLERQDAVQIEKRQNPETGAIEYYLSFDEILADTSLLARVWSLLDVSPGLMDIRIIPHHGTRPIKDAIILDTRPPMSILYYLSQAVQVPRRDKLSGKVTVTRRPDGTEFNWKELLGGIMAIQVGEPDECCPTAVSVHYRGHTFWIADNDLDSKSTFSMLTQVLNLQAGEPQLPYLTIPLRD